MPKNRSKAEEAARNKEIRELQTEYNELRKTANRRMYRLEKLAERPEYKSVLGYAYKNAAYDIKALGAKNERRFPGDIGRMSANETDIRKLKAYINTAKEFLSSASSTKRGIDTVYAQRAESLNRSQGTNFTTEDMSTFFNSSMWEKLENKYGSGVAMKVIAKIQKNAKQIVQEIEKARKAHKKIDISVLHDVDYLDLAYDLSAGDKKVIENIARIQLKRGQ